MYNRRVQFCLKFLENYSENQKNAIFDSLFMFQCVWIDLYRTSFCGSGSDRL